MIGKKLAFVVGNDRKVHAVDLGARREAWVSEEFKDPPQFRVRGYSPQGLLVDGDKVIVLATATLSAPGGPVGQDPVGAGHA